MPALPLHTPIHPPKQFYTTHTSHHFHTRDGPWPYPTQAHFWPAVNKGLNPLWPGCFWPDPMIFDPKQKKLINLRFLEEIFQTQRWLTRSDPGQKIFTCTHHYPDPHTSQLCSRLKEGNINTAWPELFYSADKWC